MARVALSWKGNDCRNTRLLVWSPPSGPTSSLMRWSWAASDGVMALILPRLSQAPVQGLVGEQVGIALCEPLLGDCYAPLRSLMACHSGPNGSRQPRGPLQLHRVLQHIQPEQLAARPELYGHEVYPPLTLYQPRWPGGTAVPPPRGGTFSSGLSTPPVSRRRRSSSHAPRRTRWPRLSRPPGRSLPPCCDSWSQEYGSRYARDVVSLPTHRACRFAVARGSSRYLAFPYPSCKSRGDKTKSNPWAVLSERPHHTASRDRASGPTGGSPGRRHGVEA